MKNVLFLLCLWPLAVQAATQTAVPMQGGMIMPMIRYDGASGMLSVMTPADVPQLTPLLVSNPADTFDPADPWFANLDPGAQGYSFSRRYGFVMDVMTDPLPADRQIWLRKVSGPPELGFYRYSGSAPKAWEPIFGTAGSTNARFWNLMMFHPGVSAPPGTNTYSALFQAFLYDTTSGAEVPGTATNIVLNFTNVPDGRPALGAMIKMAVQWDPAATNWILEWAHSPTSATWTAVTNVPGPMDGSATVLMDPDAGAKVFRMRRNP